MLLSFVIAFRRQLKVASMQLQEYMDAKGYDVENIKIMADELLKRKN